ncbi:hypothetical protein BU15DRAFT_62403 [Melanogaster broomeanus]|nr:hypothetical protein BU15DRAFT_62403 [Melanogaster broomeanus]
MSTAPPVTSKTTSDDSKKSTACTKLTDQTNLLTSERSPLSSPALLFVWLSLPLVDTPGNPPNPQCIMTFSTVLGRKAALCLAMVTFMIGSLDAGFSTSTSS